MKQAAGQSGSNIILYSTLLSKVIAGGKELILSLLLLEWRFL